MHIVATSTGAKQKIEIVPVEEGDFKSLRKERYFFDWKQERNFEMYKLRIPESNEILGLISLERIPSEWRVHIRLLTVSSENKGKRKIYDKIAGNLIAFVAKIAVSDYAEMACVSLRPKSQIAQHYIKKYNMTQTGLTLSIEVPEILKLINLYDHDE
jgi:hypothetical protein